MEKNGKKFVQGNHYETHSLIDYDCTYGMTVVSRTDKTVTISIDRDEADTLFKGNRCKIHLDHDGNEYIMPFGSYSLCPTFNAARGEKCPSETDTLEK